MALDTGIAVISLLFNTINLWMLIKFYKANNNITTLIKLAFSDILRAIIVILTSNCIGQSLLLRYDILCRISAIANGTLIALTLSSLTLAGIDRYLAVCKPFEYTDNCFVIHFNKISVSIWIGIAVSLAVQNLVVISESCVMGSKMCVFHSTKPIYDLYLSIAFFLCFTCIIIISICYIRIFIEFFSMLKKIKEEANATKKMTVVVGTMTILFFVLYLPIIISILATIVSGHNVGSKTWIYLYSLLTVHGIVNAATYRWQKKEYGSHLRSMFRCENAVHSDVATNTTSRAAT